MNERLQSPEQCNNVKTLGAAACAQCFADCPLAQLARAPKETTANIQAGNAEAATRALLDDRVEAVSADFSGGYAVVESKKYTESSIDLEKRGREARLREAQREAEKAAKDRRSREAKARAAAQKAADGAAQNAKQRVAAQKVADEAAQKAAKKQQQPAKKQQPTLLEQIGHDLAAAFRPR